MSVAMAAVLVTLLSVFASSAAAKSGAKQGGTLRVDLFTDVDYTDPALDYLSTGWEIEYSTCLKLVNYPDSSGPKGSQLAPEAATGFPKVSNGGKTYTFTVNVPFTKFAPSGQAVTAASFKAAFDRNADPKMQSPATAFMDDVVGADKTPVSGVRVRGKNLTITLKKPAPDFLARVAMPFFCAIPTNLPHDPNGVETPPSAAPTTSQSGRRTSRSCSRRTRTTRASARTTSRRSPTRSATRSRPSGCGSRAASPTTPRPVSPPRRMRTSPRSTASTRASSSSSLSSACATSR